MNNDLINELYQKIDAQDKIINTQALEIARLKQVLQYIKEYIETHSEMTDLQICGIENVLAFRGSVKELLDIVNKALGDKENENIK